MMMIQASDNKALLPQAFQAAKDIKDEKKRAQALLDIVNEINYFTHKAKTSCFRVKKKTPRFMLGSFNFLFFGWASTRNFWFARTSCRSRSWSSA
jgi:hypothetical protein